jgi:DNA-binding NarL/FixJ family response regulator
VKEAVSQAIVSRTLEKLGYYIVSPVNLAGLDQIGPERSPEVLVVEFSVVTSEAERIQVQRLKERFPQLRILCLTDDTPCSEMPCEFPLHVDGYLNKPLTVEAIKAAAGTEAG